MPFPNLTKYAYRIRCSNGAVVDNLQIYGQTEDEARAKLMQMYLNCEVLNISTAFNSSRSSTDFDDVLDRIIAEY